MNLMVIFISAVALVASAPTETKDAVINVEGPTGRHVQTREPGKAVSGYFTLRDKDGVEYKTTYEADEKGFRATGSHLPVSPTDLSARRPIAWSFRSPISAFPIYGLGYGAQNYLPFPHPIYPQGKVLALCLTTLVASAPSDVRPLTVDTDKAEARDVQDAVKPANPAWGYFT
ncbi:uncharacterized protein LOC132088293 [Daphnia carinata]|uniref:uncharacterized protein LOC132088293 n=1 Tax=Daphnia carinata TaxID=120202 RepID=UPI002868B821|nr:uncharacterized protein LOC132088293 [Daphnia carinata]